MFQARLKSPSTTRYTMLRTLAVALSLINAMTIPRAHRAPARLREPYTMSHVERRMSELRSHEVLMFCEPMTRLAIENADAIPTLKMQRMTIATIGLECISDLSDLIRKVI
jgi:hypothetical protein